MQPRIEIIIPAFSKKNTDLSILISSILKQRNDSYSAALITVVLNPADENAASLLSQKLIADLKPSPPFSIRVIATLDQGVNSARQAGVDQSTAELLFFFDDDVELQRSDLIDQHVSSHLENPLHFAIGGTYETKARGLFSEVYGQRQIQWLREAYSDTHRVQVNYLLGGHFSIKRAILLQKQLCFDTNIRFGASETDFFLRARLLQLPLILKNWIVIHSIHDSALKLLKKSYLQGRGKKYLETKGLTNRPFFRSIPSTTTHLKKFVNSLFELSFNWGYFSYDRNYTQFFKHYSKQVILFFNYQNQRVINFLRSDL